MSHKRSVHLAFQCLDRESTLGTPCTPCVKQAFPRLHVLGLPTHLRVEGPELDWEEELLLGVGRGAEQGGVQGVQLAAGLDEQAVGGPRVGHPALGNQGLSAVEVLRTT
jgi:hypothetical protein